MALGTYAGAEAGPIAYSIGTLVTDPAQYQAMQKSFEAKGFTDRDCEFLHIDNSAHKNVDAHAGSMSSSIEPAADTPFSATKTFGCSVTTEASWTQHSLPWSSTIQRGRSPEMPEESVLAVWLCG